MGECVGGKVGGLSTLEVRLVGWCAQMDHYWWMASGVGCECMGEW